MRNQTNNAFAVQSDAILLYLLIGSLTLSVRPARLKGNPNDVCLYLIDKLILTDYKFFVTFTEQQFMAFTFVYCLLYAPSSDNSFI